MPYLVVALVDHALTLALFVAQKSFAPGSSERQLLMKALEEMRSQVPQVPIVVNGEKIYAGKKQKQVIGCDHQHALCEYFEADEATVKKVSSQSASLFLSLPLPLSHSPSLSLAHCPDVCLLWMFICVIHHWVGSHWACVVVLLTAIGMLL